MPTWTVNNRSFFVRVADLGNVVAFVATHMRGDGDTELDVAAVDFWDRKQYVVECYPTLQLSNEILG